MYIYVLVWILEIKNSVKSEKDRRILTNEKQQQQQQN